MFHGDDPVGRFIDAIIDSKEFRDAISSGNEGRIRAALSENGILLTSHYEEQLIEACQEMKEKNAWSSMDKLRGSLLMRLIEIFG